MESESKSYLDWLFFQQWPEAYAIASHWAMFKPWYKDKLTVNCNTPTYHYSKIIFGSTQQCWPTKIIKKHYTNRVKGECSHDKLNLKRSPGFSWSKSKPPTLLEIGLDMVGTFCICTFYLYDVLDTVCHICLWGMAAATGHTYLIPNYKTPINLVFRVRASRLLFRHGTIGNVEKTHFCLWPMVKGSSFCFCRGNWPEDPEKPIY